MSLTPEQREVMDLALGLLVTIYDAGYYRDKINEALPRLRAALSQEPEQPAAEGGLRVGHAEYHKAYCATFDAWVSDGHTHWIGPEDAAWQAWMHLHDNGLAPPPHAAVDPSKNPDSIDTSEPHVDDMEISK